MAPPIVSLVLRLLLLGSSCVAEPLTHRKLLQRSVMNCTQLHSQCRSCSVLGVNSVTNSTAMACLACSKPAYQVTTDAASCDCSPGYYLVSGSCLPCGKGGYCSGAGASRLSCGIYLTTESATAAAATSCITLPGVAFMAGPSTAAPCPVSTYNAGGNQRNCTECPGSLVTELEGSRSVIDCSAPPGRFYRGQQALPCSVGTYKEGINKKTSCKACPTGTTTLASGAASPDACSVILAGYQAILDNEQRVVGAAACLEGTFSPAGADVCYTCPAGLTTLSNKIASPYSCLAPPGIGFYANGLPDGFLASASTANATAATTVLCPVGWFKSGYNTEACQSCGEGLLTVKEGATSADECFLPAGWGSKASSSGSGILVASKCVLGTYGVDAPRYGLSPSPCLPCPEFTTTLDVLSFASNGTESAVESMLFTSIANCSNLPGYGWENGIASECPAGYYAAGYDLRPCTACGEGLTTVRAGSTKVFDCIALPGWEVIDFGVARSCQAGSWSIGGLGTCMSCPAGSTSDPMAASLYDCLTCLPGWGAAVYDSAAGLPNNSSFETCAPCQYGTYSPGGSGPCVACDDGFTSPALATDSTNCIPRFSSLQPYSSIALNTMAGDASISFAASAVDAAACQAACSSDCHFWVFRTQQNDNTNGCWLKNTAATPSADTYIAYKVVSDYIVWPANTVGDAQLGNSVSLEAANVPSKCREACDAEAACLGFWVTANSAESWQCRLLAGEYRRGVKSFISAEPSRINIAPWSNNSFGAAPPTPLEAEVAYPSSAVPEPASVSPNPAAPAVVGGIPVPEQSSPAVSRVSPVVEQQPAGSNTSMPTLQPASPSTPATTPVTSSPTANAATAPSGDMSAPEDPAAPASASPAASGLPGADNSSMPVPRPAALNTPAPNALIPVVTDQPAPGDSGNSTAALSANANAAASSLEEQQLSELVNSYETNVGLPAPNAPADAPAGLAAEEQPHDDSNTTALLVDTSPAPATHNTIASPSPAADEQLTSGGDSFAESPAAPTTAVATQSSPPVPEQQQEDANIIVGWAIHFATDQATATVAPSLPFPAQQPALISSDAGPTPPSAAAPATSAEATADLQKFNNNLTAVAAAAPHTVDVAQPSRAVEALQGLVTEQNNATAASPSMIPTVVDQLAGSSNGSTTAEPVAHTASVQDGNAAAVNDISMMGQGAQQ